MSGLVESATAVMRMAERRLDVVATNVANLQTPGYKRRVGFADAVANAMPGIATRIDPSQAAMTATGGAFDLALSGEGMFRVRAGERFLHTRQGNFRRGDDGSLVTPQGYVLQQAGGGDLHVDGDAVRIGADGSVFEGTRAIARIAVERGEPGAMTPVGESFFAAADGAMTEAEGALVRQGMLEGSNVSLGDEMTQSMLAVRQAESGARLIQLYDELIGRAVSAFGGNGR